MSRRLGAMLVVLLLLAVGGRTLAQSEEGWGDAVNLSRSGAASLPVVVAADGQMQAFWWDAFEGMATARYDGAAWSEPAFASIFVTTQAGDTFESEPLGEMPQIVGDGAGWAHAWWLDAADRVTGLRALMHSRLAVGNTTWSAPDAVSESVLVWRMAAAPDGTLHLVYVRPTHTDVYPAGVYYRRSTDGGATWSAADVLYGSIYFRPLAAEDAHVWVDAGADGQVVVAWDDPRLEQAFFVISTDDGASWSEPRTVGSVEEGARRARALVGPQGTLLLWEASRVAAACALYQQQTSDGGATWSAPERVLEDLGACPGDVEVLHGPQGQPVAVLGSGSGGLTLVAWDGASWSAPQRLGFSFEDPALERRVYLDGLCMVLDGGALAVVGHGQDGEVWFLEGPFDALAWAFAPPSAWSEPLALSQDAALPGLPAVAADVEGQVHVLWSAAESAEAPGSALAYARYDGARWTSAAEVLSSPEGKAGEPALAAFGSQLHAVWSGGAGGEVFYSRAYVRDAYAASGWSDPVVLPAPGAVGGWPALTADLAGVLHVVYAVPLNEGRGVYYTTSEDGGETWLGATAVFDAQAAGWAAVAHPTLAVDELGVIHVAWVRVPLPGNGLPEGIFYARSLDRGETWSDPVAMVEGAADWPRLAATLTGQVHVLWEASAAWQQRWSADGGGTWTRQERLRGLDGAAGPVGLVADGSGALHLAAAGRDGAGEPALVYAAWDGERWGEVETRRLPFGTEIESGAVLAVRPEAGMLDVAFRAATVAEDGARQVDVWYAGRSMVPVTGGAEAAFGARPTPTPTPGPAPTAMPTPRPTVSAAPPLEGPPVLELGPVTLPVVALVGMGLALALVVAVVVARSVGRGR